MGMIIDDIQLKTTKNVFVTRNWKVFIPLIVVLILGTFVRLDRLTSRTITHIEMYVPGIELPYDLSRPAPRLSVKETLIGLFVDQEPHPPAYYLLMYFWNKVFGNQILALRLPSVLFGVLSIGMVYIIGEIEGDRKVALLAASLLVFNGYHIYWSNFAKMYIMGSALGLLSTVSLLYLVRAKTYKVFWQILYFSSTMLGLATVFFFWFLFIAQGIWLFIKTIASDTPAPGLLRFQLLMFIIGSPLLGLAAFQSGRESYLEFNLFDSLLRYLQFGFLFEPDPFSLPPKTIPLIAGLLIGGLGLFLLIKGLTGRGQLFGDLLVFGNGPSPWWFGAGSILSALFTWRLSRFTTGFDAERSKLVLWFCLLPVFIFLVDYLLRKGWPTIRRVGGHLRQSTLWLEPFTSISCLLAILPVILVAILSLFVPIFAPRTVFLFTPFLLIVIARGLISLTRKNQWWFVLVAVAILVSVASMFYYRDAKIETPTDYKGLAELWVSQIEDSDMIFIQPHWATTPVFYFLSASRYRFIGQDYAREVEANPASRIWVVMFEGLQNSPEMDIALRGFNRLETIEALRIKAVLFAR